MARKTKWPKKMKVSRYLELHYMEGEKSKNTLIAEIKRGDLPGVKEGGLWFVWVLPNGDAAYGYNPENLSSEAGSSTPVIQLTGNALADGILERLAEQNGIATQ